MDGATIVKYSVGGLVALSLIVEIAPIKINPWRWILKKLGNVLNSGIRDEIKGVKDDVQKVQEDLNKHVKVDDERNADLHRSKILRFNNELIRRIPHTKEDFIEVLADIDAYNTFCKTHEDYKNNRAKHAIANIERCYDERLQKHDFLQE